MKNTYKNIIVLLAVGALALVGVNSAVADSQSNGNSIYEDGIDKLISSTNTSTGSLLVASSQSNGNSIYEDGIDKLISLNSGTGVLIARSQSNGNSIYEDNLGKLVG